MKISPNSMYYLLVLQKFLEEYRNLLAKIGDIEVYSDDASDYVRLLIVQMSLLRFFGEISLLKYKEIAEEIKNEFEPEFVENVASDVKGVVKNLMKNI